MLTSPLFFTVSLFFSLAFQSSFCVGAGFSTPAIQKIYNKYVAPDLSIKKAPARKISFILPRNWLCTLPAGILEKIREMLMGTKWIAYKELIPHKLSFSLAQQMCVGLTFLPPLFSNPIALNKKKISHPDYGTLSFAKDPESVVKDGRSRSYHRVVLTHQNPLTGEQTEKFSVLDVRQIYKAYFSPDDSAIIVEYLDRYSNKAWTCLDPVTLNPLDLTVWEIPHKGAAKFFLQDIYMKRQIIQVLPGIPFTSDGRFITREMLPDNAEPRIVDLATRRVLIPLKTKGMYIPGHHIPFYQLPGSSQVLINQGDCITLIDPDKQTSVGLLAFSQPYIVHGAIDRKIVDGIPTIATQTTAEQRKHSYMVTETDSFLLVMSKTPSTLGCIMFEGVLSGALDELSQKNDSKDEKRVVETDKKSFRDKFARSVDIRNKLNLMKKHPNLIQFARCYPTLGHRYVESYDFLCHKLPDLNIPIEKLDVALDLFLETLDQRIADSIKSTLIKHYHQSRILKKYRDGRHLHQDICIRFPQFNNPSLRELLEECIVYICNHNTELPRIVVSEETIDNDLQAFYAGSAELKLPIQEWLVCYYTSQKFKSMQEIKEDLSKRFDYKNVPALQLKDWNDWHWNDWLIAIKETTHLPELFVSLDTLDQAFEIAQSLEDHVMKEEILDQIITLITSQSMDQISDYTNIIKLLADIPQRFHIWQRLRGFHKKRILEQLYTNLQEETLPILDRDNKKLKYTFNLVNQVTDPNLKIFLIEKISKFFVHRYKRTRFAHRISLLNLHVEQFPSFFSHLSSEYQLKILHILSKELKIPSWQFNSAECRTDLETSLELIKKINEPTTQKELINIVGTLLVRYYHQDEYHAYDKARIIEEFQKSPLYTSLSVDIQQLLIRYLLDKLTYPTTSHRSRLRAAIKAAGGGKRMVEAATKLYENRKRIGFAAGMVMSVYFLERLRQSFS